MLKKLIKYTDYDGRERAENFYFYLSKAELMEMELGVDGGMQQMIQLIIDKQDIPKIMAAFKRIILKAYGEKSPDGRRFIKSDALSEAFSQTEAYSNLYIELVTNAEAAAAFINGIVPVEVAQAAIANKKQQEEETSEQFTTVTTPAIVKIKDEETNKDPQDASLL